MQEFNPEEFFQRIDRDQRMLVHLFNLFKSGYPAHITKLKAGVDLNSAGQVKAEAHSLWGELVLFGYVPAIKAAAELEKMGAAKTLGDALKFLNELNEAVQPILLFDVSKYINELSKNKERI